MELVVRFLNLTQAGSGQYRIVGMPGGLSYGFVIRLTGRGTVPLELVRKPQRPESSTAEGHIVGVQALQGATRLDHRGFRLVRDDRQSGSYGRDLSPQVGARVIENGTLACRFGRLQFFFDAGRPASH